MRREPGRTAAALLVVGSIMAACSGGGAGDEGAAATSGPSATAATDAPSADPVVTSAAGGTDDTPAASPDEAATEPTAPAPTAADVTAAIGAATPGLPADAEGAARALVHTLRTTDDDTLALGATAELLRRAGFPLVTNDGTVVALPDDAAFSDVPVYVELLPNVTRSVRAGDLYPVDAVGRVLFDIGSIDAPMPWRQLAVAVAGWGKDAEAPASIRSAAATIRALSGERGQVFAASQTEAEQGMDALALLILVAHAGGAPVPVPAAAGPSGWRAAREHPSRPASCDELQQRLSTADLNQLEKLGVDIGKWGWGTAVDHALDYWVYLDGLGVPEGSATLARNVRGAFKAFDYAGKAAGYASILLLLLGATLDLSTDKLVTHYKHEDGSTAEHVEGVVYAEFVSGLAQERIACFGLGGLDVPKNGPMSGFNIKWSLGQDLAPSGDDIASAKHLRPTAASMPKFTLDKTDGDGLARVVLKPAVEDRPRDDGDQLRATVRLTAHLEKGEVPFSLSDLLQVLKLNPVGTLIEKSIDGIKSVTVDELLPTAGVTIGVTYHGSDAVVARVDQPVDLMLYTIPRVYADLVSCDGLAGPYTGVGGYSTVGIDTMGEISNAGLGAVGLPTLPASSPAQEHPLSVMANPGTGGGSRFLIAEGDGGPFVEGVLDVRSPDESGGAFGWVVYDVGDGRLGKAVGELELLLAGNPWPFGDLTATVYRVESDPRCPAGGSHFDAS